MSERANGPSPADPSGQRLSTAGSRDVDCHTLTSKFTKHEEVFLRDNCSYRETEHMAAFRLCLFQWSCDDKTLFGKELTLARILCSIIYPISPGQNKPYPQPHRYCHPQLFAGIPIWPVMFFHYLPLTAQLCQQNSFSL